MTQSQSLRDQYIELHKSFNDKIIAEEQYKQKLAEIIKPENLGEIKKENMLQDFVKNVDVLVLGTLKQAIDSKCPDEEGRKNELKEILDWSDENKIECDNYKKRNWKKQGLDYAAKSGCLYIFKYFIEDCKASEGVNLQTPLRIAADNGHLNIFKYLVENCKAKVTEKILFDYTALDFASMKGHLNIVKYIIEECNLDANEKEKYSINAFLSAIRNNHLDIVKYAINNLKVDVNKEGGRGLHIAVEKENLDMVKYLCGLQNINVNIQSKDLETPLHIAIKNENLDIVKYLCGLQNIEVNIQSKDLETPLHIAIKNENLDIVKYLCGLKNINVNIQNKDLKTPLRYAIQVDNIEIFKALIECKNINLSIKDKNGKTALDLVLEILKEIDEYTKTNSNPNISFEGISEIEVKYKEFAKYLTEKMKSSTGFNQLPKPSPSPSIENSKGQKQVDTKLGTVRRFLTNVISPVVMTLAAPYVKLYSLIASPVMAIADYLFNGKKAKSVILNSMLEIATYVAAGMLVGMFGLSASVGYASIIATSAALNFGIKFVDERMLDVIGDHSFRADWVKSLKKEQQVSVDRQ